MLPCLSFLSSFKIKKTVKFLRKSQSDFFINGTSLTVYHFGLNFLRLRFLPIFCRYEYHRRTTDRKYKTKPPHPQ